MVRINIYAGTDIWRQDRLNDNLDFELEDIRADGASEEANNE
jgi:hypothetical protein